MRSFTLRDEILTVLPGTLPADRLASQLAGAGPAVVLKLGRTFSTVRDALAAAGRLDEAYYVERATMSSQRIAAKFVFVGRHTLYGVAAGGIPGAARALGIFRDEVDRALAQIGAPDLKSLGPQFLMWKDLDDLKRNARP